LLGLGCPKQAFAKIATPRAIKEKDIDYSDIPELDESFWNNAVLVHPGKKERLTVRFDADVVQWVQKAGKGLSNQNEHGFKKLL
jgi:uncharacterized protein (DUF4415 family)